MHFIGVFTKNKNFERIKEKILEQINMKDINIININNNNINNLKNIVFETIVICDRIQNFNNNNESYKKIFANTKYLIMNSEINFKEEFLEDIKCNIITYGLNHKSTITISSISDDNVLISLQRNIENIEGKTVEMEEISIRKDIYNTFKIEDFMVIFAILLIYSK